MAVPKPQKLERRIQQTYKLSEQPLLPLSGRKNQNDGQTDDFLSVSLEMCFS